MKEFESSLDDYLRKQVVFTKAGFLTGDALVFALKVGIQSVNPVDLSLAYCALKSCESSLIKVD
jgi:hypothetical protein